MFAKRTTLIALALACCALVEVQADEPHSPLLIKHESPKAHALRLRNLKEGKAGFPIMVHVPHQRFEIGKYEVTQKQWRLIMGSNPSYFSSCGDNCPVEMVSWNDVQEFLAKLNKRTGKHYRLPTENEWDYACRGGGASRFCGSDDLEEIAWYGLNSFHRTHPVGQKQPNGYGLYDMTGNVWEWVQVSTDDKWHVLRGGSWGELPQAYRMRVRMRIGTGSLGGGNMGLRLARTLP